MLRGVFEADPPAHTEVDDLEIADPIALSEDDQAAFQELQDLEEHFNMYQAVRFNPALIRFASEARNVVFKDYASVLSGLSLTDPESRHVSYRLRGFQSLIPELEAIRCTHPGLVSQRDDLLSAIKLEIERMLSRLRDERDSHTPAEILGMRNVSIDTHPPYQYVSPLVTSAIVLVSIIHAIMGVARDHCNFILSSLRAIIYMTAKVQDGDLGGSIAHHINSFPITLPTALHRLSLSLTFDLYASCPKCCTLYRQSVPMDLSIPEVCTARNLDGADCGAKLSTVHRRGNRTWHKPISRYSHLRFETWVSELLLRPGVEELLEAARPNPNPGPTASDVWDAPYLRAFPDSTQPFIDSAGDLRLVMMLHFDFFNPFQNKLAGKIRSVGAFFMVCLNLPPDIRYSASNAYLVAMVPGPTEKSLEEIHHFINPIVDDMLELYSPGIWISRTYKYPRGRRVQAAIAIKSMDIVAARGAGGFASHSHTRFCHLCAATRAEIDRTSLGWFQPRTVEDHRQSVVLWQNAQSLAERKKRYDEHGVRNVGWLRFPWWNPFTSIVIGPMHWTKNILDKQLRQNMEWSWTIPFGIPEAQSRPLQPISTLEYEWGTRALLTLDESGLKNAKLTAPLLHYLCRQRGIFEAGLSSQRLTDELNAWRKKWGVLSPDGELTEFAKENFGQGVSVGVARAHYYVSRHPQNVSAASAHSYRDDLVNLCTMLGLPKTGQKADLVERLLAHYVQKNVRTPDQPNGNPSGNSKSEVAVLGYQVLSEVKEDMGRTTLPSWLKHPPINFATLTHGKIQAEEYKSLTFVSFTITLVRLWGMDMSSAAVRQRLDHFLHLMLAVRILAFQTLSDLDIDAFELHYGAYLSGLKVLYPTSTVIPVQHLGLHIPQFLRSLGPSTRWSESTCEQFIGMFQNISTNFKFGDLELTLHREFVMAARLRGMIDNRSFTAPLGEFGKVVQDYLHRYVPGQAPLSWQTSHSRDPIVVPELVHQSLTDWSEAQPQDPTSGTPRIVLIVRAFKPLTEQDALQDPYRNHPIIGSNGAGIVQIYYNNLEEESHLIEPRDLKHARYA
ncbi:hypothetical protein FRC06_007326 [Ceratobasidium sp. 370]|nr:hypothetical protein FRC06_007326 [Ceratobasidium sp. 370]